VVILLAEDRDDVRLAMWNLFKGSGFTVVAACDGIAAREASRNYPGTIDLLLSDMDMRRMNGLELCQTIATERAGIKVLIMATGLQELEQVYMKGMPFLQKPFMGTALRGSIQALLV
jgi:CheY-like chemotaxis protein